MDKKKRFDKILADIKSVKIQGARNIAKKALDAYSLFPTKQSTKKLFNSRPTEPMMHRVLNLAEKKVPYNKILQHFDYAQNKINNSVSKLIKNNGIVFTHCHSTNVVNALVYAKRKGRKFEVYNTETRPLFQGRKTAKELAGAGIKVTLFADSAIDEIFTGKQGIKKPNLIFLGADALMKKGIINKIGSELIAKTAKQNKIPVYIIADSWKFTNSKISLEQRNLREIWDKAPKKVKIKNPAFEFVNKKYIKGIVSEYGVLSYSLFLKRV